VQIGRYRFGGSDHVGIVADGTVRRLENTLDQLVIGGAPVLTDDVVDLSQVEVLAPIPESSRGLFCTGINYVAHQAEAADYFAASVPEYPIIFFKTISSVTGPYDDLDLRSDISSEFDWEVELGVVIGTGGRDIPRESALDHVFGYTIVNDITARDVQRRHQQWHLGKNVDASTPVGPWIVTRDDAASPPSMTLTLTVNGVEKQSAHTSQMIFDIAEQIAAISRFTALRPGDILSTGTPAGVGFTRQPPEFLVPGDLVNTAIEGIGVLRNRVVDGSSPSRRTADTGGSRAH
jgi:2-keto-4-pentenoate hydratase/2-oxohepta-3-ene-1,7-dioic acid hydratase in catechol pathway